MQRTILKLTFHGEYRVVYDGSVSSDHYRVIYKRNGHQAQMIRLDTLSACMIYLTDIVSKGDGSYK